MFKRVLLCHDGTEVGRRALKQGAELAISLGAEVHVLILPREEQLSPSVVAGSLGHVCLFNEDEEYRAMLSQSVDRLRSRGVHAQGHLARGNVIEQIVAHSKSLAVDLVVVGQYPNSRTNRWWAGAERASLAEKVNCAVLIAVATN
jgi:nucleotide-binding universal stress UspA family protein